jgi:hypothetical protein
MVPEEMNQKPTVAPRIDPKLGLRIWRTTGVGWELLRGREPAKLLATLWTIPVILTATPKGA